MRRADWRVRDATAKDFEGIGGDSLALSSRAWVLETPEKLVGIGGVFLKKGAWTAFVRVVDYNVVPKSVLVRAMKIGFNKILSMKLPTLCAIKEKELCTADNLLSHFGFRHISTVGGEEVFVYDGNGSSVSCNIS